MPDRAVDLRLGTVRAAVRTVGGGLRLLRVAGVPLVEEHAADAPVPAASGAVLFPWPNRVRDGRWRGADGREHRLVLTEPGRGTANHGLVTDRAFAVVRREAARVTLRVEVRDEPGYPFRVRLDLTYRLLPDGLAVDAEVTNLGVDLAPFALGFHPYPRVGDHAAADLALDLGVDGVVEVDDRLLPLVVRDLPAPEGGPRCRVVVADRALHDCLRSVPDAGGRHVHRLVAPDGTAAEMSADGAFGWVQVYACPDFPRAGGTGTAVAVEPMTAPPDALNSGTDLVHLEPGATWSAGWSLHAVP
ncbi:hypothetical protein [Cellulomonas triticagri]|uniref:Aldose epimerase n=1 Tax=Cellulomonas triticagri TaxID=2483352 RepID=A0A3M2J849_9CELL|nr:hypothetical protein [Cellulomonas triticagri]RMI09599.1 hypothetical protein EBM89_09735 [Cellulomonas triticagri]